MSILSYLSDDFLTFLDRHNLKLTVLELPNNNSRIEFSILYKDGPYLIKIIKDITDSNKINIRWIWVTNNEEKIKKIGYIAVTISLYVSLIYGKKGIVFFYSDYKKTIFPIKDCDKVCFLCEKTSKHCLLCDGEDIINKQYSYEYLLSHYEDLYSILVKDSYFPIKFVKNYMESHHNPFYFREKMQSNGTIGDISGSDEEQNEKKKSNYYIEFVCEPYLLTLNISRYKPVTDNFKIIILHLLAVYPREYIKIYYKKSCVEINIVKPPKGAISFFEEIGILDGEAKYSDVKPHIERLWNKYKYDDYN